MPNNSDSPPNTQDFIVLPAKPISPPSGVVRFYADPTGKMAAIDSTGNSALSGITNVSSIPGQPGLTAVPVQSGLMAEYRLLPTENPCAALDYSGNGNNATGCTGTSPTIIAGSGGVLFAGVGAIQLPAVLNTALTVQIFFAQPTATNAGAILAGNGAASNLLLLVNTQVSGTNDSVITGFASGKNFRILNGRTDTAPLPGVASYPRAIVTQVLDIAIVANGAAADQIYLNGINTNSYLVQGNATWNGHQTNGNYQLGGLSSCPNWAANLCGFLNGKIYYALFYNRLLTATEVMANHQYMAGNLASRNVNLSPYKQTNLDSGQLVMAVDGDSLSCGSCAQVTPLPVNPYSAYFFNLTLGTTNWSITNQAEGGRSLLAHLVPGGPQAIDPLFYPYTSGNLALCLCGTNDGSLASYQAGIQQWSRDRRSVGFKTIVIGIMDGSGDAGKNSFNGWIRQHWREFADGFVDLASDPILGADGARNNVTDVFTTDNLHVQDNGIINHETPLIQRAINRLYGNHDFSTATTYVAPALAPTATTAGISVGVNNVLTFGATPANCQAGNWVSVAGMTPAGYNGVWFITSRTGTTLTYHNFPSQSNLGAASVQGTAVCPQQQDPDEYQVVNFGAGNYSLQTCMGMTGQRIYIRNINAAATTLLPWGSETITGAGATPTTLAANTTAILESQLVSSAAAGCNWVRIQ